MLPRTLQKRRQIDAWELDELGLETKTGRDVDDVNDSDPTPLSVLQQAFSPSHCKAYSRRSDEVQSPVFRMFFFRGKPFLLETSDIYADSAALKARSRAVANLDSVCCVSPKAQRSGTKPECDASLYEQRGSECV